MVFRGIAGLLILVLLALAASNLVVSGHARGKMFDDAGMISDHQVGLVFGCPPASPSGAVNFYFRSRIEAAAALYRSGRVDVLLLSGSSDGEYYDEPRAMKRALLEQGVPEDKMWMDREGDRTLLSIQRARDVYKAQKVILVSQGFHNKRALFLAHHAGLDAVAYNARDLGFLAGSRTRIREYFARARAVADVYFF